MMGTRRLPMLPPRWLRCPCIGSMLVDLFIPFKTPLDSKFRDFMPPEEKFDVETLFDAVEPARLGLVIDLTKSTRFYHRREIETHNCKYIKIACKGREETPTPEQVNLFINLVDKFETSEAGSGRKIGVHCTHGFNRTGFLIVSYLVEERNFSLECALQLFAEARPPGIYKGDYLKDLFNRYGDPEDCFDPPILPDWCNEEVDETLESSYQSRKRRHPDSPDDDAKNSRGAFPSCPPSPSSPKIQMTQIDASQCPVPPGEPRFMSGVSGVCTLDQRSYEAHHIREVVDYLIVQSGVRQNLNQDSELESSESRLDIDDHAIHKTPLQLPLIRRSQMLRFRGSQPVSMGRQNFNFILHRPYVVTYKSDGTRYLLLIHGPEKVYLVDRANFVYRIDTLHFPTNDWLRNALEALKQKAEVDNFLSQPGAHLVNTLLDGELVAFDTPDRPFKFLIYDVLSIMGYFFGKMPFEQRLNSIERFVLRPRNEAGHAGLVDFLKQSFSVRKKPFSDVSQVAEVLKLNRQTLQHDVDGLIFQPNGPTDFYVLGTCPDTLKWKPPEMNTIDFRCKVYMRKAQGEISEYRGDLYLGGDSVPTANLSRVTPKDKALDGKIVECTVDPVNKCWKVLRVRTDKTEPNHRTVGRLIMESIIYPVSTNDILRVVTSRQRRSVHSGRTMQSEPTNKPIR